MEDTCTPLRGAFGHYAGLVGRRWYLEFAAASTVAGGLRFLVPLLLSHILTTVVGFEGTPTLIVFAGLLILLEAGSRLICATLDLAGIAFSSRVAHALVVDAWRAYMRTPADRQAQPPGTALSALVNGSEQFRQFLDFATFAVSRLLCYCIALVYIFAQDWRLGLCTLVPLTVFFIAGRYSGRLVDRYAPSSLKATAQVTTHIRETLSHATTLKIFGASKWRRDSLLPLLREDTEWYQKRVVAGSTGFGAWMAADMLYVAGLIAFGGSRVISGDWRPQEFITLFMIIRTSATTDDPIGIAIHLMTRAWPNGMASFRLIRSINCDVASGLRTDRSTRGDQFQPQASPTMPDTSITATDMSFSYEARAIFSKASFELPARTCTVITGPSGAGKSTLFKLLLGFAVPTQGDIRIGGASVTSWDQGALRRQIALVPQEPVLFAGSIRENFQLVDPEASDTRITELCHMMGLSSLLSGHEAGLGRPVGENGKEVSRGQRQRLAIARALLRDPRIILFDEPTSALDAESEGIVMRVIKELSTTRTCVVITHKQALLDASDAVFELRDHHLCRIK